MIHPACCHGHRARAVFEATHTALAAAVRLVVDVPLEDPGNFPVDAASSHLPKPVYVPEGVPLAPAADPALVVRLPASNTQARAATTLKVFLPVLGAGAARLHLHTAFGAQWSAVGEFVSVLRRMANGGVVLPAVEVRCAPHPPSLPRLPVGATHGTVCCWSTRACTLMCRAARSRSRSVYASRSICSICSRAPCLWRSALHVR